MIGSYYQLGHVGPGIDVSHYGAPYQGMLGIGGYDGAAGCLACSGLGWTPAPGQTPGDDPRMVKGGTKVRQTFRVQGVPSGKTGDAASAILREARRQFAPNSVTKASGDGYGGGWGPGGRVGVDVWISSPTRLGLLKMKGKAIEHANPASSVAPGARVIDARTGVAANRLQEAPGEAPAPPGVPADADAPAPSGGFMSRRVGGVPVWSLGLLGVAATGGLVLAMKGKKKATLAANRRRMRRSRRSK